MSAPAPSPTTDTSTPTPSPQAQQPGQQGPGVTATLGIFSGVMGLLSILFVLLFSYGAAKLSYDKYQSIGWAILNFFFASFYYPYYAIFLSGPSNSFGGRRRR